MSEVKALRQQLRVLQQLEFNANNDGEDEEVGVLVRLVVAVGGGVKPCRFSGGFFLLFFVASCFFPMYHVGTRTRTYVNFFLRGSRIISLSVSVDGLDMCVTLPVQNHVSYVYALRVLVSYLLFLSVLLCV